MLLLAIGLFEFHLALSSTMEDCIPDSQGLHAKIVNVSLGVTVSEQNDSESNHSLTLTYSWNIEEHSDQFHVDGFVARITNKETLSDHYYMMPNYENPFGALSDSCNITSGKALWLRATNGSAIQCYMPCTEYLTNIPAHCHTSSVCRKLNHEEFTSLPASTNYVSLPVESGAAYIISLYAYHRWMIVSTTDDQSLTVFCNNELIEYLGWNRSDAKKFCDNIPVADVWEVSSGPPANFQIYSVKHDYSSNTVTLTVRWMDPYDLSPMSKYVAQYAIHVTGGEQEHTFIKYEDRRNDSFYYLGISELHVGQMITITITPKDDLNSNGQRYKLDFPVPEPDACQPTHSYCDINANCIDLIEDNGTPALCSCRDGYIGNGINSTIQGGGGCVDYDACSYSKICVKNGAVCIDDSAPSMGANCSCKKGYYGDGRSDGSGCRNITPVIILTVGLPATLTILIAAIYRIRRKIKHMKNGSRKLSRFFAVSNVKYTSPVSRLELPKMEPMSTKSGAFGEKYEVRRDLVKITGVIGRGNFGVVHKGTLKLDSEILPVALKAPSDSHSHETKMEFLSEIALIISLGKHEHILSILGCCTTQDGPTYLITPFMKYGDLLHFLWDCREERNRTRDPIYILKEGNIYDIGQQVASGLQYITGLRIIHGDIAARNVLVDEGLRCKISDFGLANDVYRYGVVKGAREKRVPMKWISPERMQEGRVPITWRSDVWSFGILLYEMATLGSTPFPDISIGELFGKLQSGYRMAKPPACSFQLYSIMCQCWEWIPSKRPSFQELQAITSQDKRLQEQAYANIV